MTAAPILINPIAGNAERERLLGSLRTAFHAAQRPFEVYETVENDGGYSVAKKLVATNPPFIAIAGGDGSVSSVATALAGSRVPLGIIPVGTANLVARELRIPLEAEQACKLLASGGRIVPFDTMRIGDRHYLSHISLGVYSSSIEEASVEEKRRTGRFAYVRGFLKQVVRNQSWVFEIEVDGKRLRTRGSLVLLANVGTAGVGSLSWGKHISACDGVVDLAVMRGASVGEYARLFWSAVRGKHSEAAILYMPVERRARISCRKRLPVRADGEVICEGDVEIEVAQAALRVVAPPENG